MDESFEQSEPAADLKRSRRKRNDYQSAQRLPPHSPEAEQACLGCLIIDPSRCVDECISRFGDSGSQVFYDLRNQSIYSAMIEMSMLGLTINIVTLYTFLKGKNLVEQIGGMSYLTTLPEAAPSALSLVAYLDILEDKWKLRSMISACTDIVSRIYDCENNVAELLDMAEKRVMEVRSIARTGGAQPIKESVRRVIAQIEDYHQRSGMLIGTPSGFSDFDKLTGGLINGEMFVLAGRPSLGKTSLAMNIAENVALESKLPVGVFSLEMTMDQLTMRMVCSRARVNLRNVKDGFLAERDFPKLTGSAGKISAAPLYVDDTSGLSIMDLRARARRMVSSFGIKLLVVDYLQLLIALINGRRIDKREREVSEVSGGIKSLAKELGIPIIAISQLNREIDRNKRKPTLADLRESGSLEQDADLVGLLYKASHDEEQNPQEESAIAVNLLIAKQRNGPANCDVNLIFLKNYTRFESAAKVSDEDAPNQRDLAYRS